MVFFDFGGTLFYDGRCDAAAGAQALLKYNVGKSATAQDFQRVWTEIVGNIGRRNTAENDLPVLEIPLTAIFKYIEAQLGLKFNLSDVKKEVIFDRFNSTRSATPHIEQLLETLHSKNVRAGVISNTALSGAAMTEAIDNGIKHYMESVVTSADYVMCKPYTGLFHCAASLAGVKSENCWYCGDTPTADVDGGHSAGMLPFLFNTSFETPIAEKTRNGKEYYEVNDWLALTELVEKFN